MDLPTNTEGWSSESVMATVADHALPQWGSIEAANSVAQHVVRCEEVYMIREDGKKIIDFNSQAVCVNLGYSVPEIAEAVYDQLKNGVGMAESRWYVTTVRAKVIKFLLAKMPTMDRFYFSESGATAIEAAVRIARVKTGRPVILSSSRSYHGATAGAMTLTGGGDDRHYTANSGYMENVVQFIDQSPFFLRWGSETGDDEGIDRFLSYLEEVMLTNGGSSRVAAVLLETMVGTQGAIPSPTKYLLGVQNLCRKYGALLILDEVMGGFGRTGKWFAYQQHEGLEPDIVTMAKGLTNAFAPLGGVAVTKAVGDAFATTAVPMGSTYNCHPTGLAAAWAALQLYEKRNVMDHVNNVSAPALAERLAALKRKYPTKVKAARSLGVWGALELVVPEPDGTCANGGTKHAAAVAKVNAVLREKGMVTFCKYHRHMKALYIMCNPPVVITPAQLDEAFEILSAAVEALPDPCASV